MNYIHCRIWIHYLRSSLWLAYGYKSFERFKYMITTWLRKETNNKMIYFVQVQLRTWTRDYLDQIQLVVRVGPKLGISRFQIQRPNHDATLLPWVCYPVIECFHSRGQHLCKFIRTKESICVRIGLGHQHGCRFIVLGHQYAGFVRVMENLESHGI